MGTTESIFFEEEEVSEEESSALPHLQNTAQSTTQRAAKAASRSNATAGKRPQSSRARPLIRLSGRILGLPHSGKHSLLQRLQGKNLSLDDRADSALVPYQVPRGQPGWDRIQLLVDVFRDKDERSDSPIDFAVLTVDPRHDRDRIEQYLSATIAKMLRLQGYSSRGKDTKKSKRPFCLCLLLNFCDMVQGNNEVVSESDIQQITLMALQQVADLEPALLHLQCATTSLENCYGLAILHHFIYQSYLLHKQWHLQQTLLQVHEAKSANSPPEIPSYEDYVRVLTNPDAPIASNSDNSRETPAAKRKERKKSKSKGKQRDAKPLRRSVMPQHHHSQEESSDDEQEPTGEPVLDGRNALEAFLASEDEDESNNGLVMRTDDEDEDDFFYDEDGQRHSTDDEPKDMKAKKMSSTEVSALSNGPSPVASPDVESADFSDSRHGSCDASDASKHEKAKSPCDAPTKLREEKEGKADSKTEAVSDSASETAVGEKCTLPPEQPTVTDPSMENGEPAVAEESKTEIRSGTASEEPAEKGTRLVSGGEEPSKIAVDSMSDNGREDSDGPSIGQDDEQEQAKVSPSVSDSSATEPGSAAETIHEELERVPPSSTSIKATRNDIDSHEDDVNTAEGSDSDEEFFVDSTNVSGGITETAKPAESTGESTSPNARSVHAGRTDTPVVTETDGDARLSSKLAAQGDTQSRAVLPSSKSTPMASSSSSSPGLSAAALASIAAAQQEAELMLKDTKKPKKKKKEKKKKSKDKKEKSAS